MMPKTVVAYPAKVLLHWNSWVIDMTAVDMLERSAYEMNIASALRPVDETRMDEAGVRRGFSSSNGLFFPCALGQAAARAGAVAS